MIVAFGATHGRAEPVSAEGAHTLRAIFRQVFFGLNAALSRGPAHPVIGRRLFLLDSRVRQKIARQLLACKHVKRFVIPNARKT